MIENIWCFLTDPEKIICNGTDYIKPESPLDIHDYYFWIYLGIYILLTMGAGTMSGLTLGLLSLDTLSLEILMKGGIEPEAKYAERLYPIIKRHHILLVTLLLGNAACVESMPIFLDRISNPITAILVSISAILIFGEIIPQALCKRYGLAIGYYMRPIVYFLMGITIFISYPLSKVLDLMFGHENGSYYRRPQLKALIDLHGPSGVFVRTEDNDDINYKKKGEIQESISNCEDQDKKFNDNQLSIQEVNIIKGAMDLTMMTAKDAQVPLNNVFMLSDDTILNDDIIQEILHMAHSRIPVYQGSEKRLIRGIILTKMLIQFNPLERTSVKTIIENRNCFQPLRYVTETTPLYELLQLFKTGKTGHMAVVVKDNIGKEQVEALERFYTITKMENSSNLASVYPPVTGIITLEDVLEKLIQSEIHDEGDIYRKSSYNQLMYKQKLLWSKYNLNTPGNLNKHKSDECKSMPTGLLHKENDEQTPIFQDKRAFLYRTFMDV